MAYLKSPEMHGKVTIFPSGKLISVGSKSLEQAQRDLERTTEALILSRLIDPTVVKAELRNIVAVQNLKNPVDLEELSFLTDSIYEPEQFPGLILRQESPKVTYLIFSSGKVVITGCRSIKDLENATENLKNII